MARNDERRLHIADTAIATLADAGARGLTFRTVDAAAKLPTGTTSNYFRSRTALIGAVIDRIGERLAPDPGTLRRLGARDPGPTLFGDYIRDIIERLLGDRNATVALFELRLNATRDPEIGSRIENWLRSSFEADVDFTAQVGLPGGPFEIALLHYAVEGYVFDQLTAPVTSNVERDRIVAVLVDIAFPQRS